MDNVISDRKFPRKIFVTVYSEVACPICKIVKKFLVWMEEEYFPHIVLNEVLIGSISTNVREGTMFNLQRIGYNSRADNVCTEFFSIGGQQSTPIIMINNEYKISGIDVFMAQVNELLLHEPKDVQDQVMASLTEEEREMINSNQLDGIGFSSWFHDNVVYPLTGISSERVFTKIEGIKTLRDNLFQKIIMEAQQNGNTTTGQNTPTGM